jgi:hypothetical protein
MKKYFRQILPALGVILTIGAVVTLGGAVDSRYAKSAMVEAELVEAAEEVTLVSARLDRKILQDKIDYKQKQIWDLQNRWTERFVKAKEREPVSLDELKAFMFPDARETLRDYEKQLEELKAELRALDA